MKLNQLIFIISIHPDSFFLYRHHTVEEDDSPREVARFSSAMEVESEALSPEHTKWVNRYSLFLKLEAITFATFPLPLYFIKFGFVWHNAGPPFSFDITPASYVNMVLALYFVLGLYLWFTGGSSAKIFRNKALLGFVTWGAMFAHATIMLVAVFVDSNPVYVGPTIFGAISDPPLLGLPQYAHTTHT